MWERSFVSVSAPQRVRTSRRTTGRMASMSAMSEVTARSLDSFNLPVMSPVKEGLRHSLDFPLTTSGPPSTLPPLGFGDSRPPTTRQAAVGFDGYDFWKQYQTIHKRRSFLAHEPGAEVPARTMFETTFIPRQVTPKVIHSFKRPKPQAVARQIVPDDPKSTEERLLPSIDREKMTKLPTNFGKSKRLIEAPHKESGIFYSDGEVENSKTDINVWGSLASLKGKEFTRKRDMIPHPTAMTVHYFNGGAPGSPKRKNRRTCMAHVRSDSSRVDFRLSKYGTDSSNYI